MDESLFLVLVFVATFFIGFLVHIVFLPFIILSFMDWIRRLVQRAKNIDEHIVFRWTVAFIVAFAVAIIICQCKEDSQGQSFFIEIYGV